MTGQQVAEIVAEIYPQVPQKLAHHLVDPNMVLVMAGLKGESESSVLLTRETEPIDLELRKLNQLLLPNNLSVVKLGKAYHHRLTQKWFQSIRLSGLHGYANLSLHPVVEGLPPFETSMGFAGLEQWRRKVINLLEEKQREGTIPSNFELIHLFAGFSYGYPRQAIWDDQEWAAQGKQRHQVQSMIHLSDFYDCPQPGFLFFPEHVDDPNIKKYISDCEKVLSDFYHSSWHQKMFPELVKIKDQENAER